MQPEFLPTFHVIQFKLNEPTIDYYLKTIKAITGEGYPSPVINCSSLPLIRQKTISAIRRKDDTMI
jgi:hypothetical protein